MQQLMGEQKMIVLAIQDLVVQSWDLMVQRRRDVLMDLVVQCHRVGMKMPVLVMW